MSDHRTSYQLPSHYVVEESHKDTDNATQPKQPLLMDIPAEPCPQSSSHADCDVLQQLQDSAPKDFLENSLGCHDNTLQSPETPELEPRSPDTLSLSPAPGQNMPRSPDTLSLSPASPLLSFSQKMEELVYAGTKLSASPQISTKKRRAPQPPKTAGSALPPPPVRALRPLPQRKGPNPPPSAVGEPKKLITALSDMCRKSGKIERAPAGADTTAVVGKNRRCSYGSSHCCGSGEI